MCLEEPISPEVGKSYIAYDDGKLRPTRAYKVVVQRIQKLSESSDEVKFKHKEECRKHPWLGFGEFADPTILVCDAYIRCDGKPTRDYFAPAKHVDYESDGFMVVGYEDSPPFWFGFNLGWWSGRLDVSGELTDYVTSNVNPDRLEEWKKKIEDLTA